MQTIQEKFDEKFPLYPDFSEKGNKYYSGLRKEIKSFILSEMTALMKECVGEEKEIITKADLTEVERLVEKGEHFMLMGENRKRQELINIAAKHGIKI